MLDFRTFSNISMQLNPDLCIDLLINKIEYNKKKTKNPSTDDLSALHIQQAVIWGPPCDVSLDVSVFWFPSVLWTHHSVLAFLRRTHVSFSFCALHQEHGRREDGGRRQTQQKVSLFVSSFAFSPLFTSIAFVTSSKIFSFRQLWQFQFGTAKHQVRAWKRSEGPVLRKRTSLHTPEFKSCVFLVVAVLNLI